MKNRREKNKNKNFVLYRDIYKYIFVCKLNKFV